MDRRYESPKTAGPRHTAGSHRRLRKSKIKHQRRLHKRARKNHPPRRQGANRGILRARGLRAYPQRHDKPRPYRMRRAAASLQVAKPRANEGCGGSGRFQKLCRKVRSIPIRRAHPQRNRAADDAWQEVCDVWRRPFKGGRGLAAANRHLPRARPKRRNRHAAGPAYPL